MKNLFAIIALIIATVLTFTLNLNAQDFFMNDDVEDSFTIVNNDNDFRIESAGALGARPRTGNCASELYGCFDQVFPEGITIGTNENTLVFTSAESITAFLPSFGSMKTIPTTMIDPTSRELRSTFAARVLALKLSVMMDQANADFAGSNHTMATCTIKEGLFAGTSVARFLSICDAAIAGETTAMPVKLIEAQLNDLCSNYAPGTIADEMLKPARN